MKSINKKCILCDSIKTENVFIYTDLIRGYYSMELFCPDCCFSYFCQIFNWQNEDIEDYLKWLENNTGLY